jgi:hydroxyacylglutathione hydrolase
MLEIVSLTLGPVATNTYLIADPGTGDAAVIDPAWEGAVILARAKDRGWRIGQFWYTHAHFDHFGGAAELALGLQAEPAIALHAKDHFLWQMGGGGALFGFRIDRGPQPGVDLASIQTMTLGSFNFDVLHTPGHTPGHCAFFCASAGVVFSGDLIFQGSVGRTDLPGGSTDTLIQSIRTQIFTLPDATRILSGHGLETTVGEEKRTNPFVGVFNS